MSKLLHDLLITSVQKSPNVVAIRVKGIETNYANLLDQSLRFAQQLSAIGVKKGDRIAVYLPKQLETIITILGVSMVGGIFVPINPLLKTDQVEYIVNNCQVTLFVSSTDRIKLLGKTLSHCRSLGHIMVVSAANDAQPIVKGKLILNWDLQAVKPLALPQASISDTDRVAILYTSGSTGKPKGVVLSHRNMVVGAKSVASYLHNQASDRILAVLPFSFDYGLSQLTTALYAGACIVLIDYLFPRDILTILREERITGFAAVPPLWIQLAKLDWPSEVQHHLRYITNSGGAMPVACTRALQSTLPNTQIVLMYGLTEAFRSTYLNPNDLNQHPDSIGKAIPNVELKIVRPDGSECTPGEEGELVHRGPLIALGYWNDPQQTARRFKPWPVENPTAPSNEIAVWSGDTVKMDKHGFLYFMGRKDDMIKTSGYRLNPAEIEDVIHASPQVDQVVVLGVPDPVLGQRIVAVVTPKKSGVEIDSKAILNLCKSKLPAYMLPTQIEITQRLPKTPNGKIDKKLLLRNYSE